MKEKKLLDTTIEMKSENFEKFIELVRHQWEHGGVKYALSDERESTDMIVEAFGVNWILGTMMKYLLRFKNLGREKDLLKVATYCMILWLKHGFHLNEKHDEDIGK